MSVLQISKIVTNGNLRALLASFVLLCVAEHITAWQFKEAKDLEHYWANNITFQGYNFVAYNGMWNIFCKKGTFPNSDNTITLFKNEDLVKAEKESLEIELLQMNERTEGSHSFSANVILCAEKTIDDYKHTYYFGQGPVKNSIAVYTLLMGASKGNCVGIMEDAYVFP